MTLRQWQDLLRGCSSAQQWQHDTSHRLLVAPGDAGHVPGHGGRRGGAGSPALQPTREQVPFSHRAPFDISLPEAR